MAVEQFPPHHGSLAGLSVDDHHLQYALVRSTLAADRSTLAGRLGLLHYASDTGIVSLHQGGGYITLAQLTAAQTWTATQTFSSGFAVGSAYGVVVQVPLATSAAPLASSRRLQFTSAYWTGTASAAESFDVHGSRRAAVAGVDQQYLDVRAEVQSTRGIRAAASTNNTSTGTDLFVESLFN